MQRFTVKKKVKKINKKYKIKYNKGGIGGGLICALLFVGCCRYSGVRGGGKCPEEEHTTCSGGPTIVIVTSAVYGERRYFIK
jgi:hypothetical protein